MVQKLKILKSNNNVFSSNPEEMLLNKYDSDYLLDDDGIEIDTVAVKQTTYSANAVPGEIVEGITYQKGRNIKIVGWVVDYPRGSMSIKKKRLNAFYNPQNLYRLDFGDRYIDAYPKSPVAYGTKYKENNDMFCKFMVTFFCPYPFLKAKDAIRFYPEVTPVSPLTDADMENPEAIDGVVGINGKIVDFSNQTATIVNPSDVPIGFRMRTKLAPPNVASQTYNAGIKLQNRTTQEFFAVEDDILSGTYELCTVPKERGFWKITGSQKQSALSGYDVDSQFFLLVPGRNTISFSFPYYESYPPERLMWMKSAYFELIPEYFYPEDEVE